MHPTWAPKLGFRPLTALAQRCHTAEQLADLVLQFSCTPPFVPIQYHNGQPVLDGGLIDNCPLTTVSDINGPMLVLLTRQYPPDRFPRGSGSLYYLQPSRNPPIGRWDYTNSKGLQETFDLGRMDAESFLTLKETAKGFADLDPKPKFQDRH